jgi:DNA-binding NarL/FixJ family response regulator
MLKIKLQDKERALLHKAKSRIDIPSERITIVLLCDSGMKASQIAQILNLNPSTVRTHIKGYIENSLKDCRELILQAAPVLEICY